MSEKVKVKVFKNGQEVGWYKDIEPGANAVKAVCEQRGWDIAQYEFHDYETAKRVVLSGAGCGQDV